MGGRLQTAATALGVGQVTGRQPRHSEGESARSPLDRRKTGTGQTRQPYTARVSRSGHRPQRARGVRRVSRPGPASDSDSIQNDSPSRRSTTSIRRPPIHLSIELQSAFTATSTRRSPTHTIVTTYGQDYNAPGLETVVFEGQGRRRRRPGKRGGKETRSRTRTTDDKAHVSFDAVVQPGGVTKWSDKAVVRVRFQAGGALRRGGHE